MRLPLIRIAVVIGLVSQVLCGQQTPSELVGRWKGVLHSPLFDIDQVLTIANNGGHYSAALNGEPLNKFRVNGDSFEFGFSANLGDFWKGKATFKGKLNEDGSAITGTVPGTPLQPFVFTRDSTSKSGIEFRVPMMPTAFPGGGGEIHIVYEIFIMNAGPGDVVVSRIEVLGNLTPATFSGGGLKGLMSKTLIKPDSMGVANMWITLPPRAPVPKRISHKLTLNNKVFDAPEVMVSPGPLPVLSPPLKGDWLANNGPGNSSSHRRATLPDGFTAQRFATDWGRFWPDGKEVHGASKDNKSYSAYGAEVYAVADGVVATVKDGIPENTPGPNSRAVPITNETIGGNLIILDIGDSRYAAYAHLQPGSLRVSLGDRVRRGQLLGLVGNSGNSTGPHLHFQVVDRNSLLASEGAPYLIDAFEVRGKDKTYQKREREIPMGGEFVRF